jgi:hypothetical protein
MAPPPYAVRRFEIEEAALLRQIRLLALKDTPEAFGTGYAQDAARSIESWQQWLITHPSFGAFVGRDPRGMVSFSRQTAANLVHRGSLVAMYVTPDLRGTSFGQRRQSSRRQILSPHGFRRVRAGARWPAPRRHRP